MADDARILDSIDDPSQLKLLTNDELAILAQEIREEIVSVTSQNGGHVASSLGATEIILAVHSLIDAPRDKFVFDVGHQAYAHKLVTGRRVSFSTLRTLDGISGFPKPSESEYDVHPSGHASDSLSIALGLAKERDLRGGNERIVALIGDASIAGGMAFEALNHIGQAQTQLVIILNDNEMSISRNVGALMKHFGALRASQEYREVRESLQSRMEQSGGALETLMRVGRTAKDSIKQFFIPGAMIYEELGIICTAPVDGHDIAALKEALQVAFHANCPVLIHAVTKKGAGYQPALDNPEKFHGLGAYDLKTGATAAPAPGTPPTYTEVFGQALLEEARKDERIVAFTAAMRSGTGLKAFSEEFPDRFVDGGIAEEHVVGMAAGVAAGGGKPVVAIYSTFLQRAIDQIIVDVALASFPVVFALDRAGLVGEDGPTHHGVFDLVYLGMIPHMSVLVPSDEAELVHALHTALAMDGPVAVRYPRGRAVGVPLPEEPQVLEVGKSVLRRDGDDVALLAFGSMVKPALEAAELLAQSGIEARVVDMRWAKPFDTDAIMAAADTKLVVTLEEGVLSGGVGSGVDKCLVNAGRVVPVLNLGIPDEFMDHGKPAEILARIGLDAEGIAASVKERLAQLD